LEQAQATLQQTKADYERNVELISKELVSAEVYERSKFVYEAQIALYDLANLELEYTGITAPFAGVIAERRIKVGNMIKTNEPAFRIINYSHLKAELHLPEVDLAKLELGQDSELSVDALPGRKFAGKVGLISPVVDPASGTVKVTVHIDNQDLALKPGMFGRINITHELHTNAILLPKEAVLAEDREVSVFVVEDSIAVRRSVQLGLVNTLNYEVVTGLKPGELVVTTGQSTLRDSSRIIVVTNL